MDKQWIVSSKDCGLKNIKSDILFKFSQYIALTNGFKCDIMIVVNLIIIIYIFTKYRSF